MASGPYVSRKSAFPPPPPRRGSVSTPMPAPRIPLPPPRQALPARKPAPPSDLERMPGPPLRGRTPAPDPFKGMGEASLAVMVYGPDGKAYGSPLAARNAGVTNPLQQPPAGVSSVPYGRAANPSSDMPMPRPGMPPSAVLKPGGVPLPSRGGTPEPAPFDPMSQGSIFKKGGAVKQYTNGGKINLGACGVSTHVPSKKNSNW